MDSTECPFKVSILVQGSDNSCRVQRVRSTSTPPPIIKHSNGQFDGILCSERRRMKPQGTATSRASAPSARSAHDADLMSINSGFLYTCGPNHQNS